MKLMDQTHLLRLPCFDTEIAKALCIQHEASIPTVFPRNSFMLILLPYFFMYGKRQLIPIEDYLHKIVFTIKQQALLMLTRPTRNANERLLQSRRENPIVPCGRIAHTACTAYK